MAQAGLKREKVTRVGISVGNSERLIPFVHKFSDAAQNQAFLDFRKQSSNIIKTTKYTRANFLPKGLREQFQKQANFYFVVMCCFMWIGTHTNLWVGTIAAWSTAAMLGMMISVSLTVSWFDDQRRGLSDNEINNRRATVKNLPEQLKSSPDGPSHQKTNYKGASWSEIKVGDVIVLLDGDEVPADIVVLTATGMSMDGTCYVSTANLDGETDLKVKRSVLGASPHSKVSGTVNAEGPQQNIYKFSGSLQCDDACRLACGRSKEDGTVALGIDNLMLRGSQLKNTSECRGLVIYVGNDTRIMMNSKSAPAKLSNLEIAINQAMWVAVGTQGLMAFVVDYVFNTSQKSVFRNLRYIYPDGYVAPGGALPDWIAYIIMFFVMYSNLVPVSLYATMEVCNAAYALFINNDPAMVHKIDGEDVSALARATNLCHELGQVSYIFSDKTGTLTKNVMSMKHICVGKDCSVINFEDFSQVQQDNTEAAGVLEVLSVCHTGVWNTMAERLDFESPDEEALVQAAAQGRWEFKKNEKGVSVVSVNGHDKTYTILATNKFSSARKRMSVVVEHEGKTMLFIKGADNVMDKCVKDGLPSKLTGRLTAFSRVGLRTLVVGSRDLEQALVCDWLERFKKAEQLTDEREESLANLAQEIEKNVTILGATAIEDELQDQVSDTIQVVRNAGIKLWVLTGDKLETAISIGYSTKVLDQNGMYILAIATEQEEAAAQAGGAGNIIFTTVDGATDRVRNNNNQRNPKKCALVITGDKLLQVQESLAARKKFVEVAKDCDVVMVARSSPIQKAQMVELVREHVKVVGVLPKPVTLAIGDGANDVPMIMAAQVGVGIRGREGRQAVNSSDFAIAQFKFLKELLLVHGRWNYRRACKFTLFTFWRNTVQVLLMCYFTPLSGFSGTTLFEDNLRITFNGICTVPIIATGLFDCDVLRSKTKKHAEFYEIGRKGYDLSPSAMLQKMGSAFMHSVIIMFVATAAYPALEMNGIGDYWTFGCFCYTLLVHAINVRVALITCTWNIFTVLFIMASYLMYVMFLIVYDFAAVKMKPGMHGVCGQLMHSHIFWMSMIVLPLIQIVWDMWAWQAFNFLNRRVGTSPHWAQVLRHLDMINEMEANVDKEPHQAQKHGGSRAELTKHFLQQTIHCCQVRRNFDHMSALVLVACVVLSGFSIIGDNSAHVQIFGMTYHDSDWDFPSSPYTGYAFNATLTDCHSSPCALAVPEDMQGPILVYYQMDPFFENYNDFVKTTDYTANSLASDIAKRTFFNDTFSVSDMDIDESNIAWPSDLQFMDTLQGLPEGAVELFQSNAIAAQHMAVWMRPAAFPLVSKHYGFIHRDFKRGESISVSFVNRYPTGSDSTVSKKRLMFTNYLQHGGAGSHWGRLLRRAAIGAFIGSAFLFWYGRRMHEKLASDTNQVENDKRRPLLP